MIAGADTRTCVCPESFHVFYPVFGTPDTPRELLRDALNRLSGYIRTLAPDAAVETCLL